MRTQHKTIRPEPFVWAPSALSVRLEAEQALDEIPRRPWGISAEARSTLAHIVAQVEQGSLPQETAVEQLRELTNRLVSHRQAEQVIRGSRGVTGADWEMWTR